MSSAVVGSLGVERPSRLRYWAMRALVAATLLSSVVVQASASWAGPEMGS
jgi:hypothetical protein